LPPVVFVAGPFRGANEYERRQNIARAEALALEVWRAGFAAITPHLNTAHFQDAAPDDVWLQGDLAILARCDAMIVTDDWQRSEGARNEVDFARSRGIPIAGEVNELRRLLVLRGVIRCR